MTFNTFEYFYYALLLNLVILKYIYKETIMRNGNINVLECLK